MGKKKGSTHSSKGDSSVRTRLVQKLQRKTKKSKASAADAPRPDPPPKTVTKGERRAKARRLRHLMDPNEAYACELPELDPKKTWISCNNLKKTRKKRWEEDESPPLEGWSTAAVAVAQEFLNRYAEMGIEGMKAEFKKEIEGYKNSVFGDTAWKANPTKNRDKDQMTCLDGSRVEFEDKTRYINASWLYDQQFVARKYILTQLPIVSSSKGDESTLDDFWQMIYNHYCSTILVLSQKGRSFYSKKYEEVATPSFFLTEEEHWLAHRLIVHARLMFLTPSTCKTPEQHQHEGWIEGCYLREHIVRIISPCESEGYELNVTEFLYTIAQIEENFNDIGPIVLMDEHSGTSRAAIVVAVDVLGTMLFRGRKNITMVTVVRWLRRCRNGAIRNGEEYVFIFMCLLRRLFNIRGIKKTKNMENMYNGIIDGERKRKEEREEARTKETERKIKEREENERKKKEEKEKKEQEEKKDKEEKKEDKK